ncbi:MAG: UDP-N-acetylmuramoyl-L-alanyl-D-glutamate--2,6-diaminopimelate ligase [Chlorobiota bacterium]
MVTTAVPLGFLLEGIPHEFVQGEREQLITAVCDVAQCCLPGSLFVAVRGHTVDGHLFVGEALRRGACGVVCEDLPEPLPTGCVIVHVPDSRVALSALAHRFFGEPSRYLRLIGVTGTNGKTTTTFFVRSVLERAGIPTGIVGTTGVVWREEHWPLAHTTPGPVELNSVLAELRRRGAVAVAMEVSSHALDQHRVTALRFAAALFTNLSHDHLDYHGTMEAYARAKRRLFELLPPDSIAIACETGDGWGRWMLEAAASRQRLSVGAASEADVVLRGIRVEHEGVSWEMRFPGTSAWVPFHARALGEHNAWNGALAATLGWALGLEIPLLQDAIATAQAPPGRMEAIPLPNGALALVDYAHTPDALERVLRAARGLLSEGEGRLFCVFGCGGGRDRAKRPLMGAIAAREADIVVLTNDNPRWEPPEEILADILSGIPAEARHRVWVIPDRGTALREAVSMSRQGDVILVAGKGHEEYQIIGSEVRPFSDRAVLRAIAEQMDEDVRAATMRDR